MRGGHDSQRHAAHLWAPMDCSPAFPWFQPGRLAPAALCAPGRASVVTVYIKRHCRKRRKRRSAPSRRPQWHSRQPHLLAGAIERAAWCFGCTQHVQHGDTDTDNCSSEKPQPDWRWHGAGLRRLVLVCNCQMSVVAQSAIKTDGCATAGQRRARADGVASAGAPRPRTSTSWSSVCTVGEVDLASSRRNCCGHGVT